MTSSRFETTNQTSLKVPRVFKPTNKIKLLVSVVDFFDCSSILAKEKEEVGR